MKKKLLMILILGMFMISFTAALDWDNIKEFDKDNGKYGQIEVYNSWLIPNLIKGDKIADIKLLEHHSSILTGYSKVEVQLYSKDVLMEKYNLYQNGKKVKKEVLKNFNIVFKRQVNESREVVDYVNECYEIIGINGTYEQCNLIENGTHLEYSLEYEEFDYKLNDKVDSGNYIIEFFGSRDSMEVFNLDWTYDVLGIETTEYATWWDNDWEFKRQINITETSGTSINNYSTLLYITYDSDMLANFSDLRFLNSTETGELDYWIANKTDSSSAWVWIKAPTLTASSTESIYMYYGNSEASSDSNIKTAFHLGDDFDDGSLDTSIWDTLAGSGISETGGELIVNGGTPTYGQVRSDINFTNYPYEIIFSSKDTSTANYGGVGLTSNWFNDGLFSHLGYNGASSKYVSRLGSEIDIGTFSANTYKKSNIIKFVNGTIVVGVDGVGTQYNGVSGWTVGGHVNVADWNGDGGTVNLDYIYMNGWLSSSPTYTIGSEETLGATVNLISPEDALQTTETYQTFRCNTSFDSNIANLTFQLNGVDTFTNSTVGTFIDLTYSQDITTDGVYNWTCKAHTVSGKIATEPNRTLTIHTTAPTVNVTAPRGTIDYFLSGDNLTLEYNVSEPGQNLSEHLSECGYFYGSVPNLTSTDEKYIMGQGSGVEIVLGAIFVTDNETQKYVVSGVDVPDVSGDVYIYDDISGTGSAQSFQTDSLNETEVSIEVKNGWHLVTFIGGIFAVQTAKLDKFTIDNTTLVSPITTLNCSQNETNFTYVSGYNNLTVFANDTFGLISTNTTTWDYNVLVNNITYQETTRSGLLEDFIFNMTYADEFSGVSVLLNYNGTNYTMSTTDTNHTREYSKQLIIPSVLVDTNVTLSFIVLLSDGTSTTVVESDSSNQTISPFLIDNCSVNTRELLIFEMLDEDTQVEINGTIEFTVNIYSYGTTELVNSYNDSYTYVIGEDSKVCLDNITGDYGMSYQIRNYGDEDQYFKKYKNIQYMTINNETLSQNITLYNLNLSRGHPFNVIVVGNLLYTTGNVGLLVDTQRQYLSEDQFKSVESSITNSDGIAVAHLVENEEIYNFLVSYNGAILGTFNNYQVKCANPSLEQCSITLNLASATGTSPDFKDYGDISQIFLLDTDTNILYNTFTSTDGESRTVRSLVIKDDGYANTTICNNTASGTSGTIQCSIPTQYLNTSFFVQTFVDEEYIGSEYFSQGVDQDWAGADILILLLMFSSLTLLFVGHPITIIIGAMLGLTMPVLLIAMANASLGSLVGAALFYIAAGIIAIILISRRKF